MPLALIVAAAFGAPAQPSTGRLHLTFTEVSPLSGTETVLKRLDMAENPASSTARALLGGLERATN